jgi:S1-C subfamily serine protease
LPPRLRPDPGLLTFDIEAALRSMVLLRADIPEDAFTAGSLGTERLGHGVVIAAEDRQVVLTIGYLVVEASSIWLTSQSGQVVQGYPLAYDYVTGFGLVQPLGKLQAPPLPVGSAEGLSPGDDLVVLAHGGLSHSLATRLVGRREFAGYWEYLLEDALFTAPAHPLWGGSALLNHDGQLVGIGSLLVQQTVGEEKVRDVNMYVPIDVLLPILPDLVLHGLARRPIRPWLGIYSTENEDHIVIAGLIADGPAHAAGVSLGDKVREVGGEPVAALADFYRAIWAQGDAGVTVSLTVERAGELMTLPVHSVSRDQFIKQPARH